MSRTSVIAKRKDKNQIKKAIIAGVPQRKIADRFHVSPKAVRTYKLLIKAQLAKAKKAGELKTLDYFKELQELLVYTKKILKTAGKDKRLALTAVEKCMELVTRLGKFSGQFVESPTSQTNIQINLFEIMPVVWKALLAFPKAKHAVDEAIQNSYRERLKKVSA